VSRCTLEVSGLRVAVLITVHNRQQTTLECLRTLTYNWPADHSSMIVLVDDGSTDGTAAAVQSEFPEVHVVSGSGDLFWSRGMAVAWEEARRREAFDGVLWLNDDVILAADGLWKTLALARNYKDSGRASILVGSTLDKHSGTTSYGGFRRTSSWHPGKNERVEPSEAPVSVDVFNGNFVYVPLEVEKQIGRIDGRFSHATGDTEYGLRATSRGVPILLIPGYVGTCSRNRGLEHTMRSFLGRKGLPPRDWLYLTRSYSRKGLWIIAFAGPYIRQAFRSARRPLVRLINRC
jgi:GT2 family glycosyltransferase